MLPEANETVQAGQRVPRRANVVPCLHPQDSMTKAAKPLE